MTPRRPIGERIAHAAAGLERHAVMVGVAVLAVIAAITYVSIIAINGVPFADPYKVSVVLPDAAPLLKDGDDVRIAGQLAGAVRAVTVDHAGHAVARLDVNRDRTPLGRNAHVTVRLRGLAGAVYVALDPGDTSRPLTEGATLPRAQSSSGVQLTQVLDTFDPATRSALSRTLSAYGSGLVGRGEHINRALSDLPPTLPELTRIARASSPRDGDLAAVLGGLRRTSAGFATPHGRELAALLPPAAGTLEALAARGPAIRRSIVAVPPLEATAARVLPVADATLTQAADVVTRLTPTLLALRRTLPALQRLAGQRPGLQDLGTLARRADPVLQATRPLLAELHDPAAMLSPLARGLAPLSAYLATYRSDIAGAAHGFTTWGGFSYPFGQAPGTRAVRFAPIFTCAHGRDVYPAPGQAIAERQPCGQ
ncbi:MlaD family protein [Paraconexibacter antarcticus]|uniref:MlaD family protein n=1 Tax=Paraconexibacter antarcticus TaxID=2949664 RepID=A0ABY5DXV4_9ACTN|nr:MlaD family protein [Paraconexibacter antarcticus]UTI66863.1 MlaD family protein [Paraconexibacter antarcticus]